MVAGRLGGADLRQRFVGRKAVRRNDELARASGKGGERRGKKKRVRKRGRLRN